MPIMMAHGGHSYRAKVAPELANRTWHPVKETYYYGVKMHLIAYSRPGSLPLPERIFMTPASTHDLEALRPYVEEIHFGQFIADKAYCDQELNQQMEKDQNLTLRIPIKRKRNSPPLTLFQRAYNTLVSKMRQPIESLFAWIQKNTSIQQASRVRSAKGLRIHLWGRLATAMWILAEKI